MEEKTPSAPDRQLETQKDIVTKLPSNVIRWALVVVVSGIGLAGLTAANPFRQVPKGSVSGARVIAEYPHDATAFTQGLVFVDDRLYEGTGKKGESSLRRIDLKTGTIEKFVPLDSTYFGEGITILDGRIYQLTWQNRIGVIYDQKTFRAVSTFRYTGEGWGLTHDGEQLILSDGTSTLRFIDPNSFEVTKRLNVRSGRNKIEKLNELEFMKGEILANVWYEDRIARISPKTGEVLGWIDLSHLYPARSRPSKEDVLNGIAYDELNNRLLVTGKNWPKIYEIEITDSK